MNEAQEIQHRLMRVKEVVHLRGEKSRTTLYQSLKDGTFTQPVALTSKSVGWLADEVQVLIRARGLGASDDQMRALVNRLHAERDSKLAALMTEGV